jgi:hypothetical protein
MFTGIALLAGAATLSGQTSQQSQDIDFRNFAYPFPSERFVAVPDKFTWMSMNVRSTVRLVNGRYDFEKETNSTGPSIILDKVAYGYLTSDKQLDAAVVLTYHSGGTANGSYGYIFGLGSGSPKLLGWFRAGSRADSGLYDLSLRPGSIVVDLLDPTRRIGDCCSEGFVRTTYEFKNGYFVQRGPQALGNVEEPKPKAK